MKNKNKTLPFCSIIVLNYYGEKVIRDTIESLLSLNYPKERYEIIIVDNGSKDDSRKILLELKEKNNQIKLIFSDKNLGFSKGNNLGISAARGEYVALINNDCFAEKDWLIAMVKTAQKDKQIFAVNSKILIYPSYLKFRVKILDLGASLTKISLTESNLLYLDSGIPVNIMFDLRGEEAFFELPFDIKKDSQIKLVLEFNYKTRHKLFFEDLNIPYQVNSPNFKYEYAIDVKNKTIQSHKYDKIQNAGIIVFFEGSGRDIGAVVCNSKQVYEEDINQYNQEREIYAATAGAVLYSKEILDKIGYLDEDYFFYYEDVDICERARFYGYKCFYSPRAVVRHLHSFSSKEWSSFFTYHAERGRLMHAFFNFPLPLYMLLLGYLHYTFYSFLRIAMVLAGKSKLENQIPYLRVAGYFARQFPSLIVKRYRKYKKPQRLAMSKNFQDILSGKWYFN